MAVLVTKGRELEVPGNGIVVLLDGQHCTGNTSYAIEPGQVFSVRNLRLLAKGQCPTLPE